MLLIYNIISNIKLLLLLQQQAGTVALLPGWEQERTYLKDVNQKYLEGFSNKAHGL